MTLVAKFDKLPIVPEKMDVYYKGINVGNVIKKVLDKKRGKVLLYLKIKEDLNLPSNTYAEIEYPRGSKDKEVKPYIELAYGDKATNQKLDPGVEIEGRLDKNIDFYIEKFADNNTVENVVGNFSTTMNNANKTSEDFAKAAKTINEILSENKDDINIIISGMAKAVKNFESAAEGLNKTFNDPEVKKDIKEIVANFNKTAKNFENWSGKGEFVDSVNNIFETTENIKDASKNFNEFTRNLNCASNELPNTITKASSALEEHECAMKQVNHTATGIGDMFSKRFIMLRMFFGKPGKKLENPPICNPNNNGHCKLDAK